MQDFKNLTVWQMARQLTKSIYEREARKCFDLHQHRGRLWPPVEQGSG